MNFEIQYSNVVVRKDIPRLSVPQKKHIRETIVQKLSEKPEVFGKPLRRSLKGCRVLRTGGYRVIFRIVEKVVVILSIQRRSAVYVSMEKRKK